MNHQGKLTKNDCDRYEFDEIVLTSGCIVELRIGGHWILGSVEHWQDAYHWFSKPEGVAIKLRNGIEARLPGRS